MNENTGKPFEHRGDVLVLQYDAILLLAGGTVQIYTRANDCFYRRTNFDDPRDQWAIEYGCQLWDMGVIL